MRNYVKTQGSTTKDDGDFENACHLQFSMKKILILHVTQTFLSGRIHTRQECLGYVLQ